MDSSSLVSHRGLHFHYHMLQVALLREKRIGKCNLNSKFTNEKIQLYMSDLEGGEIIQKLFFI